jgi:hypothetical protein
MLKVSCNEVSAVVDVWLRLLVGRVKLLLVGEDP